MTPEITINEHQTSLMDSRFFTVDFFGTEISVTVTASADVVEQWLSKTLFLRNRRRLYGRMVVGVGVQWNPFAGRNPPADTLQLCVGSRCLIFQLAHCDYVPLQLGEFLSDDHHTFVGIWNGSDENKLLMFDQSLTIHRLLDLRWNVSTRDGRSLERASFERIVEEWYGYEGVGLDNEISMSDWDAWYLSHDQVLQASVKAYVAFKIGKDIDAWDL